jgi:hypothetical protein
MLKRTLNGCLSGALVILIGAMVVAAAGSGVSWKGRLVLGGVALIIAGQIALARWWRNRPQSP